MEKKEKKGKRDQRNNPYRRKPIEIGSFNDIFVDHYRRTLVPGQLSEEEFEKLIASFKTPLPIVFRLSTNIPQHEKLSNEMNEFFEMFKQNGVDIVKIDSLPDQHGTIYKLSIDKAILRRDEKYRPFRDWLNLNTQLGNTHRQEFVSMIPPYFLDIQKDSSVLDCCAAPGSKTAQIIEMLETGFVVANDTDPRRCQKLIHQLHRVGTSNAIVVCQQAQFFEFADKQFDRILCDVPCSGDGTLRKNPAAGNKWAPKGGVALHGTQRTILKRCLELLKPGGICVYSTCSMNPIEDEAVINSVLLETQGKIEIVDASNTLPSLKRHPGLTTWTVYDGHSEELISYESFDQVPADRRQYAQSTLFSTQHVDGLEHCMRFYPQDDDSGGFFVTVLRKTDNFTRISSKQSTKPRPLREAPYIPLKKVSPEVLEEIQTTFGLREDFPFDQLFVRDEKSVRNIAFVSTEIAKIITEHGSDEFRTISCGSPIFTWKTFSGGKGTLPYPCPEGIDIVFKFSTQRKFAVTPSEMMQLFKVGHNALPFQKLSTETFQQLENQKSTGCIIYIPDTPFMYGGMTFPSSLCLYLRKDLLPVEANKLAFTYPELKPELESFQQPTEVTQKNNETKEDDQDSDPNKNKSAEDQSE